MTAHASTLIIAGGETVATFLAATTFYLLKNPDSYSQAREEVRKRFASYESINATSAQQLPYLQALISEGLRIYPPGSQGFPRISPGVMIDGHWVPQGVRPPSFLYLDYRNFLSYSLLPCRQRYILVPGPSLTTPRISKTPWTSFRRGG